MEKTDLERVKDFASHLPQSERLKLFKHLADLPDSGIRYVPPQILPPQSSPPITEKDRGQLQQVNFTWEVRHEEGRVIYSIDGHEIFTATFDAEAYVDVFYQKVKTDQAFLQVSDEQKLRIVEGVREKVKEETGNILTDEEIEKILPDGMVKLCQQLTRNSLLDASKQIANNLPRIVAMVLHRVTHSGLLSGGNRLREIIDRPKEKLSPKQLKDILFAPDWEYLKPMLGVAPRGGSDPKVDVTDEQCVQLSTAYPGLLSHWQKIEKNSKTEKHWREYAKIDEPDTPDDLLHRLDDKLPSQESVGEDYPNIPSALALEHAAQRCGIPAGEYSQSSLKNFRLRGDNLQGQVKRTN